MAHFPQRHQTAIFERAADARYQKYTTAEFLRVKLDETLFRLESRDRDVEDLPVSQSGAAHGQLWGIEIDLDDLGLTPYGQFAQQVRRFICSGKIRDPAVRAGKANSSLLQQ